MKEVDDLLFPIDCFGCEALGSYLCHDCALSISINRESCCFDCGASTLLGAFCGTCAPLHQLDRMFIATEYDQELIHKLIWNFKFAGVRGADEALARLMASFLRENHIFSLLPNLKDSILAPIPLSQNRLRERGYNQAQLLTEKFAALTQLPADNLLVRVRDTGTQLQKDRQKRWQSLEGAFVAVQKGEVPQSVLLIDDVATTGSTMEHAATVLKSIGVQKVFGLAVARRDLNA